jgi:hypothetical protein
MYLSEGDVELGRAGKKKTSRSSSGDAIFLTKGGRDKPKDITPLQSRKTPQKLVLYPAWCYGFDGHILEVQVQLKTGGSHKNI